MPLADFSLHVTSLFQVWYLHLLIQIWNRLRDCLLFKFFLLRHILIGYTNLYLFWRLNWNTLMHTFLNFTVVILTSHDFTSYSKLLPMSIYDFVFHTLIICFRCTIYATT